MKFKSGYYKADAHNGISYIGDSVSDICGDVLLPLVFVGRVDLLRDTETIYAFFHNDTDNDLLYSLYKSYGIRSL